MNKINSFILIILLIIGLSNCKGVLGGDGTDTHDNGENPNSSISQKSTVKALFDENGIVAINKGQYGTTIWAWCVNLSWPAISGASEYIVYKSDSPNGTKETYTKISSNEEPLTQTNFYYEDYAIGGEITTYYWVVAISDKGETPRPSNGGIKITYKYVRDQQIMISPGGLDPITHIYKQPTYMTIYGSLERVVGQNPIK